MKKNKLIILNKMDEELNVNLKVSNELQNGWDAVDEDIVSIVRLGLVKLLSKNGIPEPEVGAVDDGRIDLVCNGYTFRVDNNRVRIVDVSQDVPLGDGTLEERATVLGTFLFDFLTNTPTRMETRFFKNYQYNKRKN
jgi:hypothetical protein